ncbi:MAG: DUF3786 domain-containing protein [Smithellaceae bacterium]|nr:DUF3786 domain-containing protein [Smithellaceae bacterium]
MPRVDDFKNALNMARESFSHRNPEEAARRGGAGIETSSGEISILLPFFYRDLVIRHPEGTMIYPPEGTEPSLPEQILVLHYLLAQSETPLTGKTITFRETPSGEFYYGPFLKRAQAPLVKTFGHAPERFLDLAEKAGGQRSSLGAVAVTFRPFPRIPITLILWPGDEEFPPDGNILFDASIGDFLGGEDIALLAGMVVYRLMALARE